MFRQGVLHDFGLLTVALLNFGNVLLILPGGQGGGEDLLEEIGAAEVVVALDALDGGEEGFGQQTKAKPDAGGKGFAVGAGVNDAVAAPRRVSAEGMSGPAKRSSR